MEREHDAARLHHPGKFPVGFDHHDGIAGLERDDDLVKIRIDAHFDPLHGGQRHRLGRIAVFLHDIGPQRPVIQADADGRPVLLAFFEETGELAPCLVVVLVEIARIDPDLFHDGGHGDGRFRREMDVGDKRDMTARRAHPGLDLPHMRDILQTRYRDAHQLRAGLRQPQRLRHGRLDIIRMGIAHRLDDDRVVSSDEDVTHLDYACFHGHCSFCSLSSATKSRAIRRRADRVWPRRLVSW